MNSSQQNVRFSFPLTDNESEFSKAKMHSISSVDVSAVLPERTPSMHIPDLPCASACVTSETENTTFKTPITHPVSSADHDRYTLSSSERQVLRQCTLLLAADIIYDDRITTALVNYSLCIFASIILDHKIVILINK